jgi:hypothetical protein
MNGIAPLVELALEAATAAPSLFNSQPWGVQVLDRTVLVCADRSRSLPVHDPTGREMLIACGSFTAFAEMALRAAGIPCHIDVLPERRGSPQVVAALHVGTPQHQRDRDEHARTLAAVMDHTQFDRRPFTETPVDGRDIDVLRRAAESEGAWLVVLDADRRIEAAVLHSQADSCLRSDPRAAAEVRRWTREGTSAHDGVLADAVDAHSDDRACSFPLRDFNTDAHDAVVSSDPPRPERPLIVLLCTTYDGPCDAVTAGRALGRVLLEAAALGLAASPLNQSLQTALRWRLPSALRVTGVPQYQLRIGIPSGRPQALHRRVLADLLLPSTTADLVPHERVHHDSSVKGPQEKERA